MEYPNEVKAKAVRIVSKKEVKEGAKRTTESEQYVVELQKTKQNVAEDSEVPVYVRINSENDDGSKWILFEVEKIFKKDDKGNVIESKSELAAMPFVESTDVLHDVLSRIQPTLSPKQALIEAVQDYARSVTHTPVYQSLVDPNASFIAMAKVEHRQYLKIKREINPDLVVPSIEELVEKYKSDPKFAALKRV